MNAYFSHSSLGDGEERREARGVGRGSGPFFQTFIQKGLRSNWDFGWELALQVEVIFFSCDLKTPCMKDSKYESQAKNDSDCNFYSFSLLVSYPKKILVVCICILIFHGIYSSQPQIYFFCEGLIFFHVLQLGPGKIFWGASVLEGRT